jgi:flagellar basal-body rod modification protein FlgD
MASIGTALPATSSVVTASAANSQNSTNSMGNASTFLNLLVAQLQNQDPTNPVDGTTFVTQLAEFNNVEQSLAIRQDMDAVSEKYLGTATPPSDQTSTGSTTAMTGA